MVVFTHADQYVLTQLSLLRESCTTSGLGTQTAVYHEDAVLLEIMKV